MVRRGRLGDAVDVMNEMEEEAIISGPATDDEDCQLTERVVVAQAYCKLFSAGKVIKRDTFDALSDLEAVLTWDRILLMPFFYRSLVS